MGSACCEEMRAEKVLWWLLYCWGVNCLDLLNFNMSDDLLFVRVFRIVDSMHAHWFGDSGNLFMQLVGRSDRAALLVQCILRVVQWHYLFVGRRDLSEVLVVS